ncbi:PepSY-associated TM helix domain-containing protein [Chelatococcus reniformis]|uniref:Peptidase n=1 Tax=Chelatococcus reniformis TaxID=1494448 RepID=A0A916U6G1_9HYPH|nr:PepSY domain-containing protein [Chelatococcus reniformis]GGC62406.1 peptidase [Chelatococcus reniformis]
MSAHASHDAAVYRTIWRWHFYAGLIVAPFMLVLAVTGAIYLFNDEINDVVQRDLRFVTPYAEPLPASRLIAAAITASPGGRATRIDMPGSRDRSAQVFVSPQHGEPFRIFVDPGTGNVLGSHVYGRTLVGLADLAHGSLMLGPLGDNIVELAACWGFILTVTGLYLWWPRGRRGLAGTLLPRLAASGRAFWKDLHAVTGVWTALLILFLILTGLPWASLWGDLLRRGTDLAGIGYPTSFRGHGAVPAASPPPEVAKAGPWTLATAPPPQSDEHAHHHGGGRATGAAPGAMPSAVDAVAGALAVRGIGGAYRLTLPKDGTGVLTAVIYPDRPQGQRTLYIDQYSGHVLREVGFADYGWAAKAVEIGVQLHMGNYFGRLNQIVMLIPCAGIVVLSTTGVYMWWRRRPKGRLAAPRAIAHPKLRTVALIVVGLAIVFPLAGASLLIVLALDAAYRRVEAWMQVPGASAPS